MVAITGKPDAMASRPAMLVASERDGSTATSVAR